LIDLSGIIQTIKYLIWKHLFKGIGRPEDIRLKPFDCTLCSTWWTGIILMIVTSNFTLINLMLTALVSYFSKHITELLLIVNDLFVSIETLINRLIQKI
jgi:hypothetical protein